MKKLAEADPSLQGSALSQYMGYPLLTSFHVKNQRLGARLGMTLCPNLTWPDQVRDFAKKAIVGVPPLLHRRDYFDRPPIKKQKSHYTADQRGKFHGKLNLALLDQLIAKRAPGKIAAAELGVHPYSLTRYAKLKLKRSGVNVARLPKKTKFYNLLVKRVTGLPPRFDRSVKTKKNKNSTNLSQRLSLFRELALKGEPAKTVAMIMGVRPYSVTRYAKLSLRALGCKKLPAHAKFYDYLVKRLVQRAQAATPATLIPVDFNNPEVLPVAVAI